MIESLLVDLGEILKVKVRKGMREDAKKLGFTWSGINPIRWALIIKIFPRSFTKPIPVPFLIFEPISLVAR